MSCVPTTDFSLAYPAVYQGYQEMLAEKEAAKKKPKKKKENIPPKKEKVSKVKKNVKKQPTIDLFLASKEATEENEPENVSIKKPKGVVFTKLASSDPKFNNIVLSKKLITPNQSHDKAVTDDSVPPHLDQSDSYVFHPKPTNFHTSMAVSDSMMQYMEDSDSDLSQIIDDIVGMKGADPVSNILDKMVNLHVSPLTPSLRNIPKHMQTSTPFSVMSSSPLLKRVHQNIVEKKLKKTVSTVASDVFDISDSFMMEGGPLDNSNDMSVAGDDDSRHMSVGGDDNKFQIDAIGESFDEFDCFDNPSITPFAERVKKKLK